MWTWSGGPVIVSGKSYLVEVNHMGTYIVVATIGSCVSVPVTITILDSVHSKLFIYPSPNDGGLPFPITATVHPEGLL